MDWVEATYLQAFIEKMGREGLAQTVIESFVHYYQKVIKNEAGLLSEKQISPLEGSEVEHFDNIENYSASGKKYLNKTAMLILNGGLGTSMGLEGPKSLIEVKEGKTFLEIKLAQAHEIGVTPVLMNSFSTHEKTLRYLQTRKKADQALYFLQDKFPKILKEDLSPARWGPCPLLEWNPPGHGNIYTALFSSGMIHKLLDMGIRYAFICNCDNLGARVSRSILGYFVEKGYPFLMEVAQRSSQDAKGGHLARHKNGQLVLREVAQCPPEEISAFQDTDKYRFFNTNNLWLDLKFLKNFMESKRSIDLPMILKSGKLDPRDDSSPDIYQVETAMGAAISIFEGARAIQVPQTRFIPVKGTNDLLVVTSDLFLLSTEHRIIPNPERNSDTGIRVRLDQKFFKKIDMFHDRFRHGVPSLVKCDSLAVTGDVFFEKDVAIRGEVHIKNPDPAPVTIPRGRVIEKDLFY